MDFLKQFLKSHPVSVHTIAAAIATITMLYAEVPAFHNLLVHAYSASPSWMHEVATAAAGIWAFYYKSGKPAQ